MAIKSIKFYRHTTMSAQERTLLEQLNELAIRHFTQPVTSTLKSLSPRVPVARSATVNFALGEHITGEEDVLVFIEVNLLSGYPQPNDLAVKETISSFNYLIYAQFPVEPQGDYYGRYNDDLHQVKLLFKLRKD